MACNNPEHYKNVSVSHSLSVSIQPLKYFVSAIAGNDFTVKVLVPPGQSAENFEPTPGQIQQLSDASVHFSISHFDFEKALNESAKALNPDIKIIDLSKGLCLLQLHEHTHQGHSHSSNADPHIWLSIKNAKIFSKQIYQALCNTFPKKKNIFTSNFNLLISKLDNMDKNAEMQFAGFTHRNFIIYHPALGYFARDYNLIQNAIEADGKEPAPSNLKRLVDLALKDSIHTIFIQKEFDDKYARSIASEINGKIIYVDALSPNWVEMMNKLIMEMKTAFVEKVARNK